MAGQRALGVALSTFHAFGAAVAGVPGRFELHALKRLQVRRR